MGTLIFDIDGTICYNIGKPGEYENSIPRHEVIREINKKYDEGYEIVFWTARGTKTGIDWTAETIEQLKAWGVKYHSLHFGKPAAALYVDDKGFNVDNWVPDIYFTASIICVKESTFREAPPIRAPSMSSQAMYSLIFSGFTDPPY